MVTAEATRIQFCGQLVVRLAGRRVEQELPRRGVALVAYLTLNRHRTIARQELVDAVWGNDPPASPRTLNTLLAKVSRVLGPDVLQRGAHPQIILPPDGVVDVEAAVDGIHRAEAAVAVRDWSEAYAGARVAFYIAERRFLDGFDLPWVTEWRQQLEDIEIRALECSVAASIGCGGPELALAEQLGRKLIERAPYRESAYRLLMEALAARGNSGEALRVYDQAHRVLHDELGAEPGPSLQELRARLKGAATTEPSEKVFVPVARTFMFTDIVRSTQLVEALGDEAWDDLLSWHDRALRMSAADHEGEEVDHAGDGFFFSFRTPAEAVECAIAIQRRLIDHRRTHGFAPQVRIGVHAAAASRTGDDYRGKGVHEAARIGALAEGGEILVSRATAEAARCRVPFSESRLERLKGVGEPVEVVSLEWREP
jgi:DNA-binding SARP family transcriptional activator